MQALVTPHFSENSPPLRMGTGVDQRRMAFNITSVLQKFVTPLNGQNIVVNITGGLQVRLRACNVSVSMIV